MSGEPQPIATLTDGTPRAAVNLAVLRTEKVSRFFIDGQNRLEVLKNVSLELRGGEVAALVGKSGCGKSTLLHLIGLLDEPNGGEIFIDGTPISKLRERGRAFLRNTRIGFIFQHYFLLPEFSVVENIEMPAKIAVSPSDWLARKAEYRARALELIERVGLKERAHTRPKTLSGGERQRVAVARALLLQPSILLCDEPTGNLDPDTGSHIMELIFSLSRKQGTAVLVVTHDRALSARTDKTYRLEQGSLVTER